MKFKNREDCFSFVKISTILLFFSTFSVIAAAKNINNSVYIESNEQMLNIPKNVIIFTGNVIVTQGKIKIKADKIIITRKDNEKRKEIIYGYGRPVIFCQIQKDGKSVNGHAFKMRYELSKNFIELIGSAYLEQNGNNIKGDKITYSVTEKKMKAYSKKGKRVVSVLLPFHFQEN